MKAYWRPVRGALAVLLAWLVFAVLAPDLTSSEGAGRGFVWGLLLAGVVMLKDYGRRRASAEAMCRQ